MESTLNCENCRILAATNQSLKMAVADLELFLSQTRRRRGAIREGITSFLASNDLERREVIINQTIIQITNSQVNIIGDNNNIGVTAQQEVPHRN
jgi:hypothetical protein